MEKKGTPASPDTALAISVLPVPGAPIRSTPLGMRAPSAANFCGSLRNSTTSCSSSLASSQPATSAKVTVGLSPVNMRARLLPKAKAWLPAPCAWRIRKKKKAPTKTRGSRVPRMAPQFSQRLGATTSTATACRLSSGTPKSFSVSPRPTPSSLREIALVDLYSGLYVICSSLPFTAMRCTTPAVTSRARSAIAISGTLGRVRENDVKTNAASAVNRSK